MSSEPLIETLKPVWTGKDCFDCAKPVMDEFFCFSCDCGTYFAYENLGVSLVKPQLPSET